MDLFGGHEIDDPVALNDQLADIVTLIGFGHATPDTWMFFEFVGGRDELIDEQLGIVGRIVGNVVVDVIEVGLGDIRTNRASYVVLLGKQPPLHLFVGDGVAFGNCLEAGLDLLLHVQLVHDVVPGGLIRQVVDDPAGGFFRGLHHSILRHCFVQPLVAEVRRLASYL